jgi:predicted dehydrogenase
VIGCGAVSKNHGKALLRSPFAEITYAVDTDRQRAQIFSSTYGGKILEDYTQLFSYDDVDVVHIVTPHYTHPQIAIDCLQHGLHVFCEKPLAILPTDARRMVQVAKEQNKRLGVCFQNRLNKASVEAKQLIDSKMYGDVLSAMVLVTWDRDGAYYSESPWRGRYETEGGGTLINQSIHTLDLLDYLCGGVTELAGVDAKLRKSDSYEVEDSGMFYAKLGNGGVAVGYCTNCYPKSKQCTVEIHLEEATLTVKQSGLLIERKEGGMEIHKAEVATGEKSEWGISHGLLIDEFYMSLRNNTFFICDAETGLASIEIVQAIQHSHGRMITIQGNVGQQPVLCGEMEEV